MIDTVKFKIALSTKTYNMIIQKRSTVLVFKNGKYVQNTNDRFRQIKIKPYNTSVTILIYKPNFIYVECSLPKIYFGENLHLLYPSQLEKVLYMIYDGLTKEYGEFPSTKSWLIQRIDLCYCWKYPNMKQAEFVLRTLKLLEYPRKSIHLYPTSLMFGGRIFSVKFYLKENEVRIRDVRRLKNDGLEEMAKTISEESKNTLRFEVELRKTYLDYHNTRGYLNYEDFLSKKHIFNFLNEHINVLMENMKKHYTDKLKLFESISKAYSKEALSLFCFYECYMSQNKEVRNILKTNLTKYAIQKKLDLIRKATIDYPLTKSDLFDISIPSPFVVNTDTYSPALADERVVQAVYVTPLEQKKLFENNDNDIIPF